jgi:ATP adenylyltransferase
VTDLSTSDLPFTYFAVRLPSDPSPKQLHDLYLSLHLKACRVVESSKFNQSSTKSGPSAISYNLALTDTSMAIIPRRAEGLIIPSDENEHATIGPIALNGTVLAGTLLVKDESKWKSLRRNESQLTKILDAIGFSSSPAANERL